MTYSVSVNIPSKATKIIEEEKNLPVHKCFVEEKQNVYCKCQTNDTSNAAVQKDLDNQNMLGDSENVSC